MIAQLQRLFAHRGASSQAPENTLSSLHLAKEQGARWLEVDVQVSADGVPWLIHDTSLGRTCNRSGSVADFTWAQLQPLDFGGWFDPAFANEPPLSFAETLKFAHKYELGVVFELKTATAEGNQNLVTAIGGVLAEQANAELPQMLFSSDSLPLLAQVASAQWPFTMAHVLEQWREEDIAKAVLLGCTELHCNAAILTQERVQQLRQQGLFVAAYTVNSRNQAETLIQMGVQGLFTDCYPILSDLLDKA